MFSRYLFLFLFANWLTGNGVAVSQGVSHKFHATFFVNVLFTHLAWSVGLEKNNVSYMKRILKNFSGGYWIPKKMQFVDYTPKVSYFIQPRQCQHVVTHHHSQKRLPWRNLMSCFKKMWQIRPTMRMEIISASGNMKHVPTWMFQQQV